MRTQTWLKLAQIAGALLMAAGVTGCMLSEPGTERSTAWLFIVGAMLYGGGRIAAWLKRDQ